MDASDPAGAATRDAAVRDAIAAHRSRDGALLPMLHAIQDAIGYVPGDAVAAVADALNVSQAEVHGVLSYYHHFRREAPARHRVALCRAEACLAAGGDALREQAEATLGCQLGERRADGALELEAVYCLGLCANAPSALVDGRARARLDDGALQRIAAECGVDGAKESQT
jgi:formate dehydrogenase subunit gamma